MAKLIIKLKNGDKNLFKYLTESNMKDHLTPYKVDPSSFKLNNNLTINDVFKRSFNTWLYNLNLNGIMLNDLEIESISSKPVTQNFWERLIPKQTQLTQKTINDFYTLIDNAKDFVLRPTTSTKPIHPAPPSRPSPIPPELIEQRKALNSTIELLTKEENESSNLMQEAKYRYKLKEYKIKEMEKNISIKIETTNWDVNSSSTLASHIEKMGVEISDLQTKLDSASMTWQSSTNKNNELHHNASISLSSGAPNYDALIAEAEIKIQNSTQSIAKYERFKKAKDELQRAELTLDCVKNQSIDHQKLLETCQDELKKAEQFGSRIEHVLIFIANLLTGFLFKFKSKLSIATSKFEEISKANIPTLQPLERAYQEALVEFNHSKETLKNIDNDTQLSNELDELNRDKQSIQTRYQALLEVKESNKTLSILKNLFESTEKRLNEKTGARSEAKEKLKAFQEIDEMQKTLKTLRESDAGATEIQGLEISLTANTKKFQEAKAALETFKAKHPIANKKMDADYLSFQVAAV